MKTDILVDAVGLIDEGMIADANVRRTKIIPIKRFAALAAAVLVLVTLSVTALAAADVEPAYELLYAVSPAAAQRLKPVREACVSNGIELEVISADIQGSRALMYVGLKDLEGDRLDGTVDLFDSYYIRNMGDSVGTCAFDGYNDQTGVASFLIELETMDHTPIKAEKVTFGMRQLLTNKMVSKGILHTIDLTDLDSFTPYSPLNGITVTELRQEEDGFHIIIHFNDILTTDNHGWVSLVDGEGNTVIPVMDNHWDEAETGYYYDFAFPIHSEDLAEYQVYGEFVSCDTLIEGDWQITFPVG